MVRTEAEVTGYTSIDVGSGVLYPSLLFVSSPTNTGHRIPSENLRQYTLEDEYRVIGVKSVFMGLDVFFTSSPIDLNLYIKSKIHRNMGWCEIIITSLPPTYNTR